MTALEQMYREWHGKTWITRYDNPRDGSVHITAKWIHPAWGYMADGIRVYPREMINAPSSNVIKEKFDKQINGVKHYWNCIDAYFQDIADMGDED
jgi:hypothetical protein